MNGTVITRGLLRTLVKTFDNQELKRSKTGVGRKGLQLRSQQKVPFEGKRKSLPSGEEVSHFFYPTSYKFIGITPDEHIKGRKKLASIAEISLKVHARIVPCAVGRP